MEATPQMMPTSSDSLFRAIATNAALIGQLSFVAKFEILDFFRHQKKSRDFLTRLECLSQESCVARFTICDSTKRINDD